MSTNSDGPSARCPSPQPSTPSSASRRSSSMWIVIRYCRSRSAATAGPSGAVRRAAVPTTDDRRSRRMRRRGSERCRRRAPRGPAPTPPVSARHRPSSTRIESVRTRLSRTFLPRRTTSATSRLIVALPRSMTARRPLRWVVTRASDHARSGPARCPRDGANRDGPNGCTRRTPGVNKSRSMVLTPGVAGNVNAQERARARDLVVGPLALRATATRSGGGATRAAVAFASMPDSPADGEGIDHETQQVQVPRRARGDPARTVGVQCGRDAGRHASRSPACRSR